MNVDDSGDGAITIDEFVEVMDVMLSKGREPEPEPELVDMDAPLTFGELRNPAKNWGKIKNAAKVAAKAGAAAAGQKAKKAVHKAIGIETIEEAWMMRSSPALVRVEHVKPPCSPWTETRVSYVRTSRSSCRTTDLR